jgi:hypothetical protein
MIYLMDLFSNFKAVKHKAGRDNPCQPKEEAPPVQAILLYGLN